MNIEVWAPAAGRVDIVLGSPGGDRAERPMRSRGDGWWVHDLPEPDPTPEPIAEWGAGPDTPPIDYAFRVDGGEPLPDPRSPWQPYGVHGPSRVVDPARFPWTDGQWPGPCRGAGVLGAVHYELHVGTFTHEGTLDAARAQLGYLADLGVDVIELMPVAAFPGRWGWGYDGVFPYAVHDAYGGPVAFARFVDAAHGLGLGVCLDVVYNHFGPVGNYLDRFGPYVTTRHTTPWGHAVNVDDEGSATVRRFLIENALRWFRDFHLDSLRLDAVHELRDDSPRHILAELSDETAALSGQLGRPLALVAESDLNDPATVTPTAEGGLGMTGQWADDVHHAIHTALTGETEGYYADFASSGALAKTLTQVFLHDGRFSTFRGRVWGAPVDPEAVDGRRFWAYLQTHDQVGNRATGDRINAGLTPGEQAIGAALHLLSAFTPMIFMGEEWSASTPWQFFTDFTDPEVGESVRDGRRAEFAEHGWRHEAVPDPQDVATREASVLRWAEAGDGVHARMLRWYRDLISLRRAEPDLQDGRLDRVSVRLGPAGQWLVMRRGSVLVAANLQPRASSVRIDPDQATGVLLAWSDPQLGDREIHLAAHSTAVLRCAVTASQ